MAKRLEDALSALEARARRDGPIALNTFRALDEYYALEAKGLDGLRMLAGVSQRELARKSGIDQGDLSKILTGKTDPRWSTVRRLVSTLRKLAPRTAKTKTVAAEKGIEVKGARRSSSAAYRKPPR